MQNKQKSSSRKQIILSLEIQFFPVTIRVIINVLVPLWPILRLLHTVPNFGFSIAFSTNFGWNGKKTTEVVKQVYHMLAIFFPWEYLDVDHLPGDVKVLYEEWEGGTQTEGTVSPNTDQHRLVNNICIFFLLKFKSFRKILLQPPTYVCWRRARSCWCYSKRAIDCKPKQIITTWFLYNL